jgi:hypothetical protein
MDRILQPRQQKRRLFKEFECMDLIPYSIALLLLLAEGYILCGFIGLAAKLSV